MNSRMNRVMVTDGQWGFLSIVLRQWLLLGSRDWANSWEAKMFGRGSAVTRKGPGNPSQLCHLLRLSQTGREGQGESHKTAQLATEVMSKTQREEGTQRSPGAFLIKRMKEITVVHENSGTTTSSSSGSSKDNTQQLQGGEGIWDPELPHHCFWMFSLQQRVRRQGQGDRAWSLLMGSMPNTHKTLSSVPSAKKQIDKQTESIHTITKILQPAHKEGKLSQETETVIEKIQLLYLVD